ncbi:MAG: hypothetical protein MJY41_01360 [Bacteroidales bacterium]|nr:hypothetical protein [Bacteroidales bacterium]
MKKNILAILLESATVALLASCTADLIPERIYNGKLVVRATTEPAGTRAALSGDDESGYAVLWQSADEISIDGKIFRLQSGEGTADGSFQLVSGVAPAAGNHYAYYPASYGGSGWVNEQVYVQDNVIGSPMKAEAVVSGAGISDLHFTNVGGLLRLTVKGSSDIKVKSVEVTADELSSAITLTCGNPVALDTTSGVRFHIAMPENAAGYSNICIRFKDSDGKLIDSKSLKNGKLVIRRSTITRASFDIHRSTGLKVATFNVDGLPVSLPLGSIIGRFVKSLDISGVRVDDDYNVYINEEGPGVEGSKALSKAIADKHWDVFGFNEDFNYHNEVWSCLDGYSRGKYQGGFEADGLEYVALVAKALIQQPLFAIDGLEFGVKSDCFSMSGEKIVSWNSNAVYGYYSNDNDGLTKKGFRYYKVAVNKDGISAQVDFIILHADAGDEAEDIKARENGYAQVLDFVKGLDSTAPLIMMGDWNTKYYRDNFKALFIDKLNAMKGISVRDAWVECCNGGTYPEYGVQGMNQRPVETREELDKILFLNRDASPVRLEVVSMDNVSDFIDTDGSQLSDHYPAEAEFRLVVK